jgi:hypothetical protein
MENSNKKVLLASILVIIVGLAGFYAWKAGWLSQDGGVVESNVAELSLKDAYPAGWPEGLPLDKERLVEEKQLDYPTSTLYSVVYRSPEQLESIYANYKVYFEKNGYTMATSTKTQQYMTIKGKKDKTEVSALITPGEGGNMVTLAVTIRK